MCSRQPTHPRVDGAGVFIVPNQPFLKDDAEKYTGKVLSFLENNISGRLAIRREDPQVTSR